MVQSTLVLFSLAAKLPEDASDEKARLRSGALPEEDDVLPICVALDVRLEFHHGNGVWETINDAGDHLVRARLREVVRTGWRG